MVVVASHKISRVPWYSGTGRECSGFRLRGCHPLWPLFPEGSTIVSACVSLLRVQPETVGPPTPLQQRLHAVRCTGLGCSGFARRYCRNRLCFLLFEVLRCFTSLDSPSCPMDSDRSLPPAWEGLPHSDTPGSRFDCNSPGSIAGFLRPSSALCAKASTNCSFLRTWLGTVFKVRDDDVH